MASICTVENDYVSRALAKENEATPYSSSLRMRRAPSVGRRDDTVGNPCRSQISRFELFEIILLLRLDTVPCRAIRGNSISVDSTSPLFYLSRARSPARSRARRINICYMYVCVCVCICIYTIFIYIYISLYIYIYIYTYT